MRDLTEKIMMRDLLIYSTDIKNTRRKNEFVGVSKASTHNLVLTSIKNKNLVKLEKTDKTEKVILYENSNDRS